MKTKVIGIGELLWDMLPSGPRMGGAPANFTCHARALGAEAAVISRVGADEAGAGLLDRLRELGVATGGVTVDPCKPTGTVEVSLGPDGQPDFKITAEAAWDFLEAAPELERMAAAADAVCFGSLGQRSPVSREAIRRLVAAAPAGALRIFDANLRQDFFDAAVLDESLKLANVCKLSDAELPAIAAMLGLRGGTRGQLLALIDRYQLRLAAFTRGGEGSILTDGAEWREHGGITTAVRDTIGAGDSFTCAVALGLLRGWPLGRISDAANRIASFVCSRDGAVPELPRELRGLFN